MDSADKKVYRAAVIGLGNIGFMFDLDSKRSSTWSHVSAYNRCNETVLTACVETDKEKTQLFTERHPDVPVYSQVEQMFANHSLDIVSIATPTPTHFPILESIAQYPIAAVFCEKPFGPTAKECRMMVSLAEEKKIALAVNHTRRWEATFIEATEIVSRGLIGEIRAMHAYYPGQIYNIGTHLYDLIRMISGALPRSVKGVFSGADSSDPSISGTMFFDTFQCMIQATGKREDLIFEVDVVGDQGRLRVLENGFEVQMYKFQESQRYSGYRELFPVPLERIEYNDRLLDAIYDIVAVCKGEKARPLCSGEDGFYAVHVAEEFLASAQNGGKLRCLCEGLNDL